MDQITNERVLQALIDNPGNSTANYPDAIKRLSDLDSSLIRASLADLSNKGMVQVMPQTVIPGIWPIPYARVTDLGQGYFREKEERETRERASRQEAVKSKSKDVWQTRAWDIVKIILGVAVGYFLGRA